MPFCPSCRYEYKPGISTCPDCGAKLVDSLPPEEKPKEYDNWIALGNLESQQLADLLLEGLRAKDIPAVIKSVKGVFAQPGDMGMARFGPISGNYTLLVPEEFVEEANNEAEALLGDEWDKARIVDIEEEGEEE